VAEQAVYIRDSLEGDLEAILKLNEAFVHFLSPLTLAGLAALGAKADYFRVAEFDGHVAAFLVGFLPGSDYESLNYQWFNDNFADFVYVDRIVVSPRAQGQSIGVKLYDDLAGFASDRNLKQLVCEYNIKPNNEGSAKFHARYGFKEVGQQDLDGGNKRVSLQAYAIR
jgi:predicted GNAT superfamily acetyltransferase